MKLYTTSEHMRTEISFEKKNQKNLITKMKFYTTSEYMTTDTLFEKKILTTKMKLYTNSIIRFDLKNFYSSYFYKHSYYKTCV